MRRYSTLVVLLSSIASARTAAGQGTSAAPTVPVPIIGIGGGISVPAGGIAKNRQPGFNLDAMAEFRTPSEPLGLRAEVLYQYFGASKNSTASDANAVAFLVNVVYHAPQSQVRPYIIGGMGLYHVTDNGNAAGFNVGTGLTIPFTPGMGAFAEARIHFALSQGPSFVTIPVTFGITF